MCYLTAREEYDQLEQQCTLPMSWEGDFCRPSKEAQGLKANVTPGRRVTRGRALNTGFPFESVPQVAGTEPLRLLLDRIMLAMEGKDPPLPQLLVSVHESRFPSGWSSFRTPQADCPAADHLPPCQATCSAATHVPPGV